MLLARYGFLKKVFLTRGVVLNRGTYSIVP